MFVSTRVYGYEIIESTTTVSPGFDGGIVRQKSSSVPPFYIKNLGLNGLIASTKAKANSSSGRAGTLIRLESSHGFSLHNNTDTVQYLRVEVKLSTHDGHFTNHERTVRLQPTDYFRDSTVLYFTQEYLHPGLFIVSANTSVSGNTSSSASNTNKVTVW